MDVKSVNRLLRRRRLHNDVTTDRFSAGSALHFIRGRTDDTLEGKIEGRRRHPAGGRSSLSKRLQEATHRAKPGRRGCGMMGGADRRQRAIVKLHYFGHAGGGGAALRAHARYVARDAAQRDAPDIEAREPSRGEPKQRNPPFYTADTDALDGGAVAAAWARSDRRHFRIILAAERASSIADLRTYTRDVMARAEAALGTRLEWLAVDHWDTDNPHTHIILRGVRDDGRDLIIPPDFVRHGLRSAARDAATERLGERTRDDAQRALHNEVRAHRVTRLDLWIEAQAGARREVRISDLRAPHGGATAEDALRGRAHELKRLGLAQETRRNVLRLEPGWLDGLRAMERHLDIRKTLMRARAAQPQRAHQAPLRLSGLLKGPGPER